MSAETAAGHLIRFAEGRLEGTLSATALGGYGSVTIEVYAHGILTASGPVAVPPRRHRHAGLPPAGDAFCAGPPAGSPERADRRNRHCP